MLLLGSAFFNATANTLMKAAFGGRRELLDDGVVLAAVRIVLNPWAIGGIACFGVSFVFLSAALTRVDLSVAYPVMAGVVFLLVLLVSAGYFGEALNGYRLFGIAAILSGIAVISLKG
jgi:multidrug transporter EmrE-like cation transporter